MNGTELTNSYFIFREVATEAELYDLLKLRYRVYQDCRLSPFVAKNHAQVDLDGWDLFSRHFGLFSVNGLLETPVGYLRVIEPEQTASAAWVRSLSSQAGIALDEYPPVPLPLMKYFPDRDKVSRLYEEIMDRGERIVETGRFALEPSFRFRKLARHMIESSLAVYFFSLGFEHATGCCNEAHSAFYRLYGFNKLAGATVSDFARIGSKSCCVVGSQTTVPQKIIPRLERMAFEYQATGQITCTARKAQATAHHQEQTVASSESITAVA